jgi:hypothetical protein
MDQTTFKSGFVRVQKHLLNAHQIGTRYIILTRVLPKMYFIFKTQNIKKSNKKRISSNFLLEFDFLEANESNILDGKDIFRRKEEI